jgi:hypothetical protein
VAQPYPSLESPRAKIERAAEHFEVLDREGRTWEKSHPYRLRGHFNRDALEYVGGLTVDPKPRVEVSLALGDYVHNLRCALDHLVWQLVIANRQVPGRSNQFPIATTPDEWRNWVENGGWLKGVHSDAVAIIKGLQPYCGKGPSRDHLLTALNVLDISDKHHVIATGALGIPAPFVVEGKWGFRIIAGSGALSSISLRLPFQVIEDDADFAKFLFASVSSDFEMEMHDNFSAIEMRFGETGKLHELSASLDDLASMGYLVQHIVDKFDPSPPQRAVRIVD